MSCERLTDRIDVICWLSVDVAVEQLADRGPALLEDGEHQVALTEQVEELRGCALREHGAQGGALGDDGGESATVRCRARSRSGRAR